MIFLNLRLDRRQFFPVRLSVRVVFFLGFAQAGGQCGLFGLRLLDLGPLARQALGLVAVPLGPRVAIGQGLIARHLEVLHQGTQGFVFRQEFAAICGGQLMVL